MLICVTSVLIGMAAPLPDATVKSLSMAAEFYSVRMINKIATITTMMMIRLHVLQV